MTYLGSLPHPLSPRGEAFPTVESPMNVKAKGM